MCEYLSIIQKRGNLNKIKKISTHKYIVFKDDVSNDLLAIIQMQEGARTLDTSISGLLATDLLEICRSYLNDINVGELSTRDTSIAITKIEEALLWLNKRIDDRIERGVLGTDDK